MIKYSEEVIQKARILKVRYRILYLINVCVEKCKNVSYYNGDFFYWYSIKKELYFILKKFDSNESIDFFKLDNLLNDEKNSIIDITKIKRSIKLTKLYENQTRICE